VLPVKQKIKRYPMIIVEGAEVHFDLFPRCNISTLPDSPEHQNGDEHGNAHWQCAPVRVNGSGEARNFDFLAPPQV